MHDTLMLVTALGLLAPLGQPLLFWAIDGAGVVLLLGYHRYLGWVFEHHPERTYRGRSDRLRRAWVEAVRAKGSDILAVQTIRNWVMSATLLASTAMLIALGVISAILQGLDPADLSHALSLAPASAVLARIKLLVLAAIFLSAFLHFALSLRYYNHTGFLINLPAEQLDGPAAVVVADALNRAAGHYNLGTRSFLLSMPVVLWLIGPEWFLVGVLTSLLMLYRFDFRSGRRG